MTVSDTHGGSPVSSATNAGELKTLSARNIKIRRPQPQVDAPVAVSDRESKSLVQLGLLTIPVDPTLGTPVVDTKAWLENFSEADLEQYRLDHPEAAYAFVVPEGMIVVGATTPDVKSNLWPILQENCLAPFVEIHDGEARYYPFQLTADDPRLAAPSDRHTGPGQIALHFPGAIISITPETRVLVQGVSSHTDLHDVDADSLAVILRFNRDVADAKNTAQQREE